jgi:hypothetical protein
LNDLRSPCHLHLIQEATHKSQHQYAHLGGLHTAISVLLLQKLLSSDVSIDRLLSEALFNQIWIVLKATALLVAALSWFLNKKDLLRPLMILCNSLLNFDLFATTPSPSDKAF